MIRIIAVAALVLSAQPAIAGGGKTALDVAQHVFTKADTNEDGVLTAKEHEAAGLGNYGATFSDFDLDNDSRVSWDEYKAVFERHHKNLDANPV